MLVSDQLHTYPPPPQPKINSKLLSVNCRWFKGGVGRFAVTQKLTYELLTSVLSGSHRDLMITWKRLGPIPEPKFSCFVIAFYPIQKYH